MNLGVKMVHQTGNQHKIDKIYVLLVQHKQGDYDFCQVPGTRQLSPLEVGEDNSYLEPKKLRKIQIHQYGQTKGWYMAC